jgi:hypothetical protein
MDEAASHVGLNQALSVPAFVPAHVAALRAVSIHLNLF